MTATELTDNLTSQIYSLLGEKFPSSKIQGRSTFNFSEDGKGGLRIFLDTLDYFRYIEEGRQPGSKNPPTEVIKQWIIDKGIVRSINSGELRSLSFLIVRSIGRRGIEGAGILKSVVADNYKDIITCSKDTFLDCVKKNITKIINKSNVTQNSKR